jgi:hypothetical protein
MVPLDQFSSIVLDIYDAALEPALWDQTLKRVFSLAGGNNAALVVYDQEKRRRPYIIAANFDPAQKRKYDEYYSKLDPLAFILERSPLGSSSHHVQSLMKLNAVASFTLTWRVTTKPAIRYSSIYWLEPAWYAPS